MGQRLVIDIFDKDNNRVANCYYHWSAYTMSSIQAVRKLIAAWKEVDTLPAFSCDNLKEDYLNIFRKKKADKEKLMEEMSKTSKDKETNQKVVDFLAKTLFNLPSEEEINAVFEEARDLEAFEAFKKVKQGSYLDKVLRTFIATESIPFYSNRNEGLVNITKDLMDDTLNWAEGYASINFEKELITFDVFGCRVDASELTEIYDVNPNELKVWDKFDIFQPMTFSQFEELAEFIELVEDSHEGCFCFYDKATNEKTYVGLIA